MSLVKDVENNDLDALLGDGSRPVLLDFHAEWCGPCKAMSPAVEALAEEMSDSLTVGKVDVDQNQELAVKYNVGSVPMLMVFVDKQQAATRVGAMGGRELREWVSQAIGSPTG
ncbi:MAG: thioredoxin [Planctomycetota bacterium]|jgi:thioredoxin 1